MGPKRFQAKPWLGVPISAPVPRALTVLWPGGVNGGSFDVYRQFKGNGDGNAKHVGWLTFMTFALGPAVLELGGGFCMQLVRVGHYFSGAPQILA